MSVFIRTLKTDDLSHLVIEGTPEIAELQTVWDAVLEAYLDQTMTDDDRYLLGLVASATLLEFQITKSEMILRVLSFKYDEALIDILQKIGAAPTRYPAAGTTNEKIVWRKKVIANVKRWKHTLIETEAEIKRLTPAEDGDKEISASFFDDIFSRLSSYFHFHIDETKVTVSRFLAMYREYKNHLLTLKKAAKTA